MRESRDGHKDPLSREGAWRSHRHQFRSSQTDLEEPVSPMPDSYPVAAHGDNQRHRRQSRPGVRDAMTSNIKAQKHPPRIDLPMRLADSLQGERSRGSGENMQTSSKSHMEADPPTNKAQWRSSKLKNGLTRPVSVSQSEFGRYHVFTILVEKEPSDTLP